MENRLMSFNEFNSLYESYGFVNEAENNLFDPANPKGNQKEIAQIFATSGATNEATAIDAFKPVMKGEKGARVVEIQKYLAINPADGIFGPNTEAKVKEFQKKNGLTVDGKVGVQTLRKMMALKGNIKTTKDQDKVITQKFIIKTAEQAKVAGVDPKLLKVFKTVIVVKNGDKTYVICYPNSDAAKTVKDLDGKGLLKANWEWVKRASSAVGKALIYTATGVFLAGVDIAAAIVGGIVSAAKFVANGVMSAVGAVAQGLANVANWAAKGAQRAYQAAAAWTNKAWDAICQTAGKVMKASVQAFTAFIDGVQSMANKAATFAKNAGYVLTGAAISAWRGIKSVLSPAVQAIVNAAKSGADFVKSGLAWIGKNVKNGAQAFAKTMKAGWDATVQGTKTAIAAGVSMAKSIGNTAVEYYNSASKAVTDMFTGFYNTGKAFWESEYSSFFGEDIIFEDLDWSSDFNFNAEEDFGFEMA